PCAPPPFPTRRSSDLRTEDFKSSAVAVSPRPHTPRASEILDLLVDLADALLPFLFLDEGLGLALLLGFLLVLHALVRAADPLVEDRKSTRLNSSHQII